MFSGYFMLSLAPLSMVVVSDSLGHLWFTRMDCVGNKGPHVFGFGIGEAGRANGGSISAAVLFRKGNKLTSWSCFDHKKSCIIGWRDKDLLIRFKEGMFYGPCAKLLLC